METAGTQITTVQTIHMSKKGATIVLVGYSKSGEMTLPMSLALDKELTFKTVFRYRHIYPMAIEAVASGKVNLKGIVTDIFGLEYAILLSNGAFTSASFCPIISIPLPASYSAMRITAFTISALLFML